MKLSQNKTSEVDSGIYRDNYYLHAYDQDLDNYINKLQSESPGNRFEEVFRLAELKRGQRVLDVGCGRGELVYYSLKKGAREAVGIDYSQDALVIAREAAKSLPENLRDKAIFLNQDAADLKLQGKFDCCFLTDIIEHLTDEQLVKMFTAIKKHLAPHGKIVMHTAPNLNWIRYEYPIKRFLTMPSTLYKRLSGKKQFSVDEKLPLLKKIALYLDICYRRDYYNYSLDMHINEQTPATLSRLLASCGFDYKVWCEDGSSNLISIICKRFWGPDIWAVARRG